MNIPEILVRLGSNPVLLIVPNIEQQHGGGRKQWELKLKSQSLRAYCFLGHEPDANGLEGKGNPLSSSIGYR